MRSNGTGRGDTIIRSMQTINRLMKGGATARELADEMGCSVRTAYRYINAASIVFPVFETEGKPTQFAFLKNEE